MPRPIEDLRAALVDGHARAPFGELIGMRLVEVDEGRVVVDLVATPANANPMGTLHGGALCTIADSAMGLAWASTLDEGESFTTLELKINFLRPVWNGTLRAVGSVVQQGKSVGLAECDVLDERARLIASATSTCMTLRGEKAAGRRPGRRGGAAAA